MKRFVSEVWTAGVAGILVLLSCALSAWGQASGSGAGSAPPLESQVTNEKLPAAQRAEAARQWVKLNDELPTVRKVLAQITLTTLPAVANGLLNALAESRCPETAAAIMAHRANFTPAARLVAINVILRRPEWTRAVLESVERGELARTEIPAEQWQQLAGLADKELASRARKLADFKPASSSPEMAALAKNLMPAADQHGDLKRGKELYDQLCLVCHTLAGQGGKVGPDLTGLGSRPRSELLLDVIDSNRSVDASYRLWTVTTTAEDSYSGRLDVETETRIEILDLTGQRQTVQRKDIAKIEVSSLSLMPVGFEALPVSDLAALLDYMCASAPTARQ